MSESDQGPAVRVIDLAAERAAKRKVKRAHRPDITKSSLAAALKDARAGKSYSRPDPACGGLELRVFGATAQRDGYVEWSLRLRVRGEFKIAPTDDPLAASKIAKVQRRYAIGDHTLMPEKARHIAHRLKDYAKDGQNPARLLVQIKTGVSIERQVKQEESAPAASISWQKAKAEYLAWVRDKRRPATHDDYRKTLDTQELSALDGRQVAAIAPEEIAEILAEIGRRAVPLAEHVQRVLSAMWSWLADAERRRRTGVPPGRLRGVKPPERTRLERGERKGEEEDAAPPSKAELGRAVAIAKSGALGAPGSDALLLLLASAQRRRTVAGAHRADFRSFDDEVLWCIPPYFRKTAAMKRSSNRHMVPLVSWAAAAERRLFGRAGDDGWYFRNRKRRPNKRTGTSGWAKPKAEHADPSWIAKLLEDIGAGFSPHAVRAAIATYGPAELGWAPEDAKLVLDHLEGFDPGDVTAQHYNTDPALKRKREMMRAWIGFLDACEAEAVAADPALIDREAQGRAVYLRRNGEGRLLAMLRRRAKRKDGRMPWSSTDRDYSDSVCSVGP